MKTGDMKSKIPQTKATSSSRSQTRTATTSVPTTSSSLQVPTTNGPNTPLMFPSKSSRSTRLKSVRFLMARRCTGRPSMFGVFSGELNNEVDRLIDETHDFPTDDEDTKNEYSSPYKTPRGKAKQKVNRIWTAGTPATAKKGTPKARESFALALLLDMDPPMGMPRLASSTWSVSSDVFGGGTEDSDDSDGGWAAKNVDATPMPARWSMQRQIFESIDSQDEEGDQILEDEGHSDVFGDDPPSMTLKETLLSADTSHFDLLGSEDMEEGMLVDRL
ncbi:hypothetical protein BDZ97DRAFT_1166152 [Flammula alnicola]|nr:hypothetical protein BDZ97DRAFT_1166152 [Flammula alnicola]